MPTRKKIKGKARRKKKTKPDAYINIGYPCPACSKLLPARKWEGEKDQSRTEVLTSTGWILVCVSGDIRLPCVRCLCNEQGYRHDQWKETTMTAGQLHTHLVSRLRQHVFRRHKLPGNSPEAIELRHHAKELVCKHLHAHETVDEVFPQTFTDKVNCCFYPS